jgi:membrane fusion protein (multidrug efflux system)
MPGRAVKTAAAALAVGVVVGMAWVPGCAREPDTGPPPTAPEVQVATVTPRDVAISSEWIGTTEGLVNAEVRSRVQGYLIAQLYTEGAPVKKGDPLYEVDPRPFEAALSQARADLAKAQAEQARTDLEVKRLAPLAPTGAVSQQEVDNAQQSNEANKAAIKAYEAGVEQAQLNLEYTKVTSPIDGIAGLSQSQIGDLVGGPSGPVLTTISTLDPIRVFIPISEQEYLRFARALETGERRTQAEGGPGADLILADGSTFPHRGTLDIVNRQVDPTTGTIRVAVRFANPGNLLRPGQYAKLRAELTTHKGALLVPQRAVVDMQGAHLVAVVGADSKVSMRPIKMGERIGSEWIVTEGLRAGEQVVAEGVQKVREGTQVTTKPYTPPAAERGQGV